MNRGNRVRRTAPPESEIRPILTALSASPKHIVRITRGSDDRRLLRKPQADAWSVQEILAHLRACADVWGQSIERMLAEEHPMIRYVSPRGWLNKTDYLQEAFRDSLRAFTIQRVALVKALRGLDPVDWLRGATFTGTTLGREATVLSYATRIADHEARHLGQIERTIYDV